MTGSPQVRGVINIHGRWTSLSVTDPRFDAGAVKRQPSEPREWLLTISLAVPFRPAGSDEDFCFKVMAAVMPLGT